MGGPRRRAVATAGVDLAGLHVDPERPTGLAAITLDARGENTIVVTPGANGACTPVVVRAAAPRIEAADLLLAQLEVPLESVDEAFRVARSGRTLRVLNAAPARRSPATCSGSSMSSSSTRSRRRCYPAWRTIPSVRLVSSSSEARTSSW